MGTQPPLPKKGAEPLPKLSAHVYCAKRLKVGLSQGDFVIDGYPAPPSTWMDQDAVLGEPLGMEVGLGSGDFVFDGDPAQKKGTPTPPIFGPWMDQPLCIAAKRLDESRWHLAWRWALIQATLC